MVAFPLTELLPSFGVIRGCHLSKNDTQENNPNLALLSDKFSVQNLLQGEA